MTWQRWRFRVCLTATCVLVPSLLMAAERRGKVGKRRALEAQRETVELFSAMEDGLIEVRLIPKNAAQAKVIVKNNTKKPLKVGLPAAFAGVPVLKQEGGFGGGDEDFGGGRGGEEGGQNQGMGGGFGGGMGMGGMGMGMGGGFFNIPPEKVRKLKAVCVCLDHGKRDPNPRIPYEIRRLESYVDRPAVIEVVKRFGVGKLPRSATQAAVWNLNNDVGWPTLATKVKRKRRFGPDELYFSPRQWHAAQQIASMAVIRAELAKTQATTSLKDSL